MARRANNTDSVKRLRASVMLSVDTIQKGMAQIEGEEEGEQLEAHKAAAEAIERVAKQQNPNSFAPVENINGLADDAATCIGKELEMIMQKLSIQREPLYTEANVLAKEVHECIPTKPRAGSAPPEYRNIESSLFRRHISAPEADLKDSVCHLDKMEKIIENVFEETPAPCQQNHYMTEGELLNQGLSKRRRSTLKHRRSSSWSASGPMSFIEDSYL